MLKRVLLMVFAWALLAPSPAQAGKAYISPDGRTAVAPRHAPKAVKRVIRAANRLVYKPYKYGGGHHGWEDTGYSCSGAVSYALHGGGFVRRPYTSKKFRKWGVRGVGRWITVYAKPGHAYAVIAGLRFDTQPRYPERGEHAPRWRRTRWHGKGFVARHPAGY